MATYQVYCTIGADTGTTNVKYGLLYNWWASSDVSNLANTGWHVANSSDYESIVLYYDSLGTTTNNKAGEAIKETGYTYWYEPNTGAANTYSWNGRGAGYRSTSGEFTNKNFHGYFWNPSTYIFDTTQGFVSILQYDTSIFYTSIKGTGYTTYKKMGFSIRLVKDTTTKAHGQSGTYTGNDGKIYRTICVSTREWLADNLCETKYRDGTPIPEVTSSTIWKDLSTGALCSYDNNWNNAYTNITSGTTALTYDNYYITPPILDVSIFLIPSTIVIPSVGGNADVSVYSPYGWTVSSTIDPNGIIYKIIGRSGIYGDTCRIQVDANSSTNNLYATVVFTCLTKDANFDITLQAD